MKKRTFLNAALPIALFSSLCSCSGDGMFALPFEDVSYVRTFPKTCVAENAREIELGKIGVCDIRLLSDSVMLVATGNTEGYISAFNLSDGTFSADFFKQGNGPGELLWQPWFNHMTAVDTPEGVSLFFEDEKGHILKWNTANVFTDTYPAVETVMDSLQGFDHLYVNDSTLFYKNIGDDMDSWKRFLLRGKVSTVTPAFEKISALSIPVKNDGYLFNILSTFWKYSPKKEMMVEASVMLNTIHIYSLDGSFAKTICVGKKPDDIERMCANIYSTIETFVDLHLYENFFAAMYSGAKQYPLPVDVSPKPKILLFDWSGNPIMQIDIPERASTFEMDLDNGLLYTLNRENEQLYCYDVSELKNI